MVPKPVVGKRLTFELSNQVRAQVERRVEGDKLATPTPTTSISDNNNTITEVVEALLSSMDGDAILFFLEMTFLAPGVRTGRRGALPKQKVRIIKKIEQIYQAITHGREPRQPSLLGCHLALIAPHGGHMSTAQIRSGRGLAAGEASTIIAIPSAGLDEADTSSLIV